MKHAEIIALAKEEGLSFIPEANSPLARIVRKAVAREREACAQIAEGYIDQEWPGDELSVQAENTAGDIRARGEEEGAC